MTPSQSRRHHSPRSNKWCVDDELLALVLQMIVLLGNVVISKKIPMHTQDHGDA